MALLSKIPKYTINERSEVVPVNDYYIDDIFDPILTTNAKTYLNNKYGNPILGTFGGYAELIDNALINNNDTWGILGPGMGLLSTFGRSMDKADDFLLGSLTEGVNKIGSLIGGTNQVSNPLSNIFLKDEDYTGTRLLAAMGNSMAKLANTDVQLQPEDFNGAWNIPGTTIELATDPGITGGLTASKFLDSSARKLSSKDLLSSLTKPTNVKSTVGTVGQLLSNYDDFMAKVAGNIVVPGLQVSVKKILPQIRELLGVADSAAYKNFTLKGSGTSKTNPTNVTSYNVSSPDSYTVIKDIVDNIKKQPQVSPFTMPDEYKELINLQNMLTPSSATKVPDNFYSVQNQIADKLSKNKLQIEKSQSKALNELVGPKGILPISSIPETGKVIDYTDQDIIDAVEELYSNPKYESTITFIENHMDALDEQALKSFLDNVDNPEFLDNFRNDIYNETFTQSVKNIISEKTAYKYPKAPINITANPAPYYRYVKDADVAISNELSNLLRRHKSYLTDTLDVEGKTSQQVINELLDYIIKDLKLPKNLQYNLKQSLMPYTTLNATTYFKNVDELITRLKKFYETPIIPASTIGKNVDIENLTNLSDFKSLGSIIKDDPFYTDLFDTLETIESKYILPLKSADNPLFSDSIQPILNANSDKFLTFKNGKFKVNKDLLFDIANISPYLDVKLNVDYFKKYLNIKDNETNVLQKIVDAFPKEDRKLLVIAKDGMSIHIKANLEKFKLDKNFDKLAEFTEFSKLYDKKTGYKALKYDPTSSPINVINRIIPKSTKDANEFVTYTVKSLELQPQPEFVKSINTAKGFGSSIIENTYYDALSDFVKDWQPESLDDLKDLVYKFGTKKERTLFDLISNAQSIRPKLLDGTAPTLAMKDVDNLLTRAKSLKKSESYSKLTTKVNNFLTLEDALQEDKILKTDFIDYLKSSNGRVGAFFEINTADYKDVVKKIQYNIQKVNSKASSEILVPINIKYNFPDGKTREFVGYSFNTKNKNILKDIKKLKLDTNELLDVTFHKSNPRAQTLLNNPEYDKLKSLFNDARNISQKLSTILGYTDFDSAYIKHAISDDVAGASWLSSFNKTIDADNLEEIASRLSFDDGVRKTFGIQSQKRALLGNRALYNQLAPIFSNDIEAILKSTFSKGMFSNMNFQTHVDLFINDNFKLSNNFTDIDHLKKVLFAKDSSDKYTGNLNNLLVVAPRYNTDGRLVGYTRFNKFNDVDLQKAFNNKESILIPANILSPLDRLLRKDAKMSNKVFAFINKYLTVPFKFGVLANPGFLVSNASDAIYKQITTFSKKYNTSVAEEMTNMAMSARYLQTLNNKFDDIYQKYFAYIKSNTDELADTFKISSLVGSKNKVRQKFVDFLATPDAKKLLTKEETGIVKLWLWLNSSYNTSVFAKDIQNLGDVASMAGDKSKYAQPTSLLERIVKGNPAEYNKLKPSTWGLVTNNPLSNSILKGSEVIESYARNTMILNSLFRNYTQDEIVKILGIDGLTEKSLRSTLNTKMSEALNTMYAANFDYENMPDFMDAVSTVIPFPTFFLKNLGYWLEIFVDKPQLIDNAISMQQGLWSTKDTSEDEFTASAKGRGAIPINLGNDNKLSNFFKGIYKPSPLASMFSAFNLINEPISNISYRLNPLTRFATAYAQPAEDIYYRPYSTNQFERNIKRNNKEFNLLEYQLHQLNPYERVLNTYLRTPTKLKRGETQLSDFLPSIFQPDFSKK